MNQRRLESIKTVSLLVLVVLSFILTGLLWYRSPAYEDRDMPGYVPQYILNEKYNRKQPFQLVSPGQVIVHDAGKHAWLRPESAVYDAWIEAVRKVDFIKVNEVEPLAKDWDVLFHQAIGLEFQYLTDVNIDFLNAFFAADLSQQQYFDKLGKVSRVWIYQNPVSHQDLLWFISDANQKAVQVQVRFGQENLATLLRQTSHADSFHVEVYPVSGVMPWDERNKLLTFARIIYLPSSAITLDRATYQTERIPIDSMNKWLFKDPVHHAISLGNEETLYMFGGQLLTYDKVSEDMVYEDNQTRPYLEPITLEDHLRKTIDFMQRHRGWAGEYLLDQASEEVDFPQYRFRLMIDGLPLYWKPDENIYPDVIQIQTGLNPNGTNGVRKYTRSLIFLPDPPKKEPVLLLGKESLLLLLKKQKIDLKTVERLFVGYRAQNLPTEKQVLLEPTWFVITNQKSTPIPLYHTP
jgi:regulatory protein YycH of two-component signal transduction system YycFG